jgi:hypothetical protein
VGGVRPRLFVARIAFGEPSGGKRNNLFSTRCDIPSVGPWLTLPARMVASEPDDPMNALPHYADIPDAGTPTPAGEPVMTIFADGPDEASASSD